ncbi:MAG: ABC transporter substrate-binding protein [Bauldia sp.]|nr:ABC transporter substrate-binding protein [Bauldia sp.]
MLQRLVLPSGIFFGAALLGGSALAQAPAANIAEGCVATFDPTADYFPDKVVVEHAAGFSVTYFDSYKVVTVAEPFQGGAPETYVLLQCGAPEPELAGDLAGATIIPVPVETVFSASATHNPMIEALGVLDRLTGVSSLAYTATQAVIDRGAAGDIVEFAPTFETNVEVILDAGPQLLMTGGADDPAYRTLRGAGIPIVANAEWLEADILGRAEWIKYIALFFNAEATAETVFGEIDAAYAAAVALGASVPEAERPLVFSGSGFQGIFYASGGASYVAQAIVAAGATYVFADNRDAGSIAFADLEQLLDRAGDAPFWINAATNYRTLADIVAEEPRLAALPASQSGQVWVYDRMSTASGALGYWELGVMRPDLILLDMLAIFHPDLVPDHDLVFYRSIEATR